MFFKKDGRWFSPFSYLLKAFLSTPENIKFISEEDASSFFLMFINTPKLAYKNSNIPYAFFKAFFLKFPKQQALIIDLAKENKFVHPHIEYFVLSLLSNSCEPLAEIFELLYDFYFKAVKRYPQWYSRIICLKFFTENEAFLSENKEKRNKLLTHFKASKKSHNEIERRYNLVLINDLSKYAEAKELLKGVYNHPNDLKFVDFLSKS